MKKQQTTSAIEKAFRKKADNYLVCFMEQCPLHQQCLRWLVGQYADQQQAVITVVNPLNPRHGTTDCDMFRKNERVMMKVGLTHLYLDMPGRMERAIRRQLIKLWGRKYYFEMRRGDRLITPAQQQDVVNVCRQHGWTGPIVYDGEQESWLW